MSNVLNCRRLESTNIISNSEWETQLTVPIVVNQGEQLVIKNVFIDTRTQSPTSIELKEDVTAGMEFGYWLNYNNTSQLELFDEAGNNEYFSTPNGNRYIVYKEVINTIQKQHISGVNFRWDGKRNDFYDPTYGGGYLFFDYQYTDKTGTQNLRYGIYLPVQKVNLKKTRTIGFNLTIDIDSISNIGMFIDEQGTEPISFDRLYIKEITVGNFTVQTLPLSTATLEPLTATFTFTVKAGVYEPDQFADVINRQIQGINRKFSSLLNPTNDLKILTTLNNIVPPNITADINLIDDIGQTGSIVDSTKVGTSPLYFGTNQFNIQYDANTSKFNIAQCHMPIYDTNGDIIKKEVLSKAWEVAGGGVQIQPQYQICGENCGVYIYSLYNTEFWETTLGFETSDLITDFVNVSITPSYQYYNTMSGLFDNFTILIPRELKTTYNFIGLDDLIIKNTSFPVSGDMTNVEIVSNDIIPLIATNNYQEALEDYGYYIIECDLKLHNNFIGEAVFNKQIKGIVSKYYSVDSYTSAGGESDISFINNNPEPVLVDSIKIRILNPDFSDAVVGLDNTLILQHITL